MYRLGTLGDIKSRRRGCPICGLIYQSTLDLRRTIEHPDGMKRLIQGPIESDLPAICHANWEVDGREVTLDQCGRIMDHRNLTRRIHLRWSPGDMLTESYLVFVTPTRYTRPNSDAPRSWGRESLFLGRPLEALGKNQALINSWLEACNEQHGERCCIGYDHRFYDLIEKSYFGVIDVRDMCLVPLPRGEKYVALSYVWGKEKRFRTLLQNVLLHRAHGGLEANEKDLPKAITDAIDVVRRLGIRYLWVDSLCIVQDSVRSWKLNAASMDMIYGNAHLTICAADGSSADAGLVAMHNSSSTTEQLIDEVLPGLTLMVSKLAETGIQKSTWNTRAWTFCERLLSKRCLIFTQGRVYFQCRSTAMSEDIVAEPKGAGWSLGLVQAPLQLLRDLRPGKRPFWVYMHCTQLYTRRRLTRANDILAAFGGISNLLAETMEAPLIFGLPSSHFDLALLWVMNGPMLRRLPKDTEEKDQWGQDEFPSWSWCGWIASPWADAAIEYKADMIEGCLQNVNEWLTNHTWIHWYIRDGHGDLRHIWNTKDDYDYARDEYREKGDVIIEERGRENRRGRKEVEVELSSLLPTLFNSSPSSDSYSYTSLSLSQSAPDEELALRRRDSSRRGYYDDRVAIIPDQGPRRAQREANSRWDGYSAHYELGRHDGYGRILDDEIMTKSRDTFYRTVPEHPFGVSVTHERKEATVEFPDQRYLQFWTWSAYLRVSPLEEESGLSTADHEPYSGESAKERLPSGLERYDISDNGGDWCGTIVLDKEWARHNVGTSAEHQFLAISHAKNFTADESAVWTYYVPREQDQSEWDLFYVLLVQSGRGGIARRVALGKVFRRAFDNALTPGKHWSEIILE
ncbi:HET-domain-containing protein [Rhizodiscina lignyota]|uniref:HET-domain-containing protein n=1 Tax=Rhizodiscina lignyota TaxID=1504668 RepID=A0A9P4IE36_9PEZI|nr:HET-domain-containing protein [Rhizodiscina lignyota]